MNSVRNDWVKDVCQWLSVAACGYVAMSRDVRLRGCACHHAAVCGCVWLYVTAWGSLWLLWLCALCGSL